MGTPYINIRPGQPDFLDLPWERSVAQWEGGRIVEVPTGIHRHPIRFVAYEGTLFAVKELRTQLARHEFDTLRTLETRLATVARPVGFVHRPWIDPREEPSGAVITERVRFAFTYRQLISGGGFGLYRNEVLNAFATLLVELHLAGCFWGDCSLSNVLYRWDAGTIDAVMIDAETSQLHAELSDGQRREDLEIMILNVAGGMADIAASQGLEIDAADMALGEDIAARYDRLWSEVTDDVVVARSEPHRIHERTDRLNALGFHVDDIELLPEVEGRAVRTRVAVGARTFHASRLWEVAHIGAGEGQARQILADLDRYLSYNPADPPELSIVRWRVEVFEPLLSRLSMEAAADADPLQLFCDLLHYRDNAHPDLPHDHVYEAWVQAGRPGYL
jgi:hypothetical protein